MGVTSENFVLGGTSYNNPHANVDFFWDEVNHNRYWLINDYQPVEYLDELPSASISPVAIPFFLADFGINQEILLNKQVSLEDVQKSIQQRYPQIKFVITHTKSKILPPIEGYFAEQHDEWIHLFYTERGRHSLLAKTQHPRVAGLTFAWYLNYKNVDWR